MNRRNFLQTLAGMGVAFYLPGLGAITEDAKLDFDADPSEYPYAWQIGRWGEDGIEWVTLAYGKTITIPADFAGAHIRVAVEQTNEAGSRTDYLTYRDLPR